MDCMYIEFPCGILKPDDSVWVLRLDSTWLGRQLEALVYCTALRHKRTVKVMRAVRDSYNCKVG